MHFFLFHISTNNNNNYDNLYGAAMRSYHYKGDSQATTLDRFRQLLATLEPSISASCNRRPI